MAEEESVISMGTKKISVAGGREMDIVTPTRYIECKNINWSTADIADLQSRFGQQAQIARDHGKIFELHSKKPIPTSVKEWLNEAKINYFEG